MFLCACLWVWTLLFEELAACLSRTWFYLSALKFCWHTHLAQKLPLSAPPRELISWLSPALQDMQSSGSKARRHRRRSRPSVPSALLPSVCAVPTKKPWVLKDQAPWHSEACSVLEFGSYTETTRQA